LPYADVAELIAERGVDVDPSTIFDWVQQFTPLYQEAARPHHRGLARTGALMRRIYGSQVGGVMRFEPSTKMAK